MAESKSRPNQSLLQEYLDEITEAGLSGATLKNRTSYCEQFFEFLGDKKPANAVPTAHDLEQFASCLWMKRATESTIKSKLSEALRLTRWISKRKAMPFPEVDTASIFAKVRNENPNRR